MAYPGYGAPGGYGGMPPQADPLYGYFSAVAGQDQQIDATELQTCLTQSGIAGAYKPFNLDTCRIMIAMLNRDRDSRMGFQEFKELWGVLNQWKHYKHLWDEVFVIRGIINVERTFMQYDQDRSGTVDPRELHAALTSWGYNLSPTALQIIVNRYSIQNRITFDDFVCCAVRLRSLTDHFRRRDTAQQGTATFTYDDFIQVSMFS